MPSAPANPPEDTLAVRRVLEAERDAERAVAAAAAEAERLEADARAEARRIAEHGDRRVLRVRARFDAAADRAIAELRQAHVERARASERILQGEALLDSCVRRVADWLLGDDRGAEGGR